LFFVEDLYFLFEINFPILFNKKKEEDMPGGGFNVWFYNNEFFKGTPIKVFMSSLEFDWGGEDPIPGINGRCFSLRYFP